MKETKDRFRLTVRILQTGSEAEALSAAMELGVGYFLMKPRKNYAEFGMTKTRELHEIWEDEAKRAAGAKPWLWSGASGRVLHEENGWRLVDLR